MFSIVFFSFSFFLYKKTKSIDEQRKEIYELAVLNYHQEKFKESEILFQQLIHVKDAIGINSEEYLAILDKKKQNEINNELISLQNLLKIAKDCYDQKDFNKALEWFTKCLDYKSEEAMYYLGKIYQNGLGVTKDPQKARKFFEDATLLGHIDSMTEFAEILKNMFEK